MNHLFWKAKISICCSLLLFSVTLSAQNEKQLAHNKAVQAIKMIDDEQRYEDGLELLKEAAKLDPENTTYPYEMCYVYQMQGKHQKTIDLMQTIIDSKDATARYYQMLGNAYDYLEKPDEAIKIYESGLKRFPESGRLYLELGTIQYNQKAYSNAVMYYESGIEHDPTFSSNYYYATLIFLNSSDPVWGMIYGELFMNLERNTKRTAAISKALYESYQKNINYTSDTSMTVTFSKDNVMNFDKRHKVKLPFGTGCYEMLTMLSCLSEKSVNMASLDRVRTRFIDEYQKKNWRADYPNVLFDYQRKIQQAGHLEAYNHWILMKGDEEAFKTWREQNDEKWTAFAKWFNDNMLKLDNQHKFYRGQY
ncbi:MAG: tetratricopeptide repeat protein [Chitinophagales bacterium]